MTVHAVAASLLLLRVVHIIMPWRSYDLSSVVANLIVTLWFNLSKYYDLNVHARHSFLTYTALLVLHALLLHQISKSTSYEKWRHPLTAITRLATIAVIRNGLEGWTMPSQNCTADLFRFILFRHGILTQIFMTLYFPLPGLYHQAVHMISTAWFIRGNSSRVCSILLDSPHDPCGYRPWLSGVFWPKVSRAGQTLAGLMFAHLDEDRLRSLDVFGQCQVSMVWLQLCLGYLLPTLLQFAFGFDHSLQGYLDELPDLNRYCVFLAQLMIITGLMWRASYFWGMMLMRPVGSTAGQCTNVG